MTNSSSTIFTMDIYKALMRKEASEKSLVRTGRITALTVLAIAVAIAPQLRNLDQAFQFIQDFTGYVTPGVVAIFLAGLFWKRATANAALMAAVLTIPLSLAFDLLFPGMAFMDRVGISFLILCAVIAGISLWEGKGISDRAIPIEKSLFRTGRVFNISSVIVLAILSVIYSLFW
jgi:SSS family solute:Na+ symporter